MRIIATLARKRTEQLPEVPTVFEAAKLAPAQARLIDWRAGIAGLGRLIPPRPVPHRIASICCGPHSRTFCATAPSSTR